jgi:hypothetical protein
MINVQEKLDKIVACIEARLLETKTPCKLYSTPEHASRADEKITDEAFRRFNVKKIKCYYVKIPSIKRYTVVYDVTSIMNEWNGSAEFFSEKGFYSI